MDGRGSRVAGSLMADVTLLVLCLDGTNVTKHQESQSMDH